MKIAKKLLKATRIFSAFILFSIFASQCFSQSNSSSSDIDSAKQRQFLKVIDQLYYFIQQNYVEEVDPQILYEGALN